MLQLYVEIDKKRREVRILETRAVFDAIFASLEPNEDARNLEIALNETPSFFAWDVLDASKPLNYYKLKNGDVLYLRKQTDTYWWIYAGIVVVGCIPLHLSIADFKPLKN